MKASFPWGFVPALAILTVLCRSVMAQPAEVLEAISREVSLFKFNSPSAPVEAISREVSVFKFDVPASPVEAISREVSVFKFDAPSSPLEAISREVSVFKFDQPTAPLEAISREVSVEKVLPPSCVPPPSGLVAWWPGDGNANDYASTNHGNARNGAAFAAGKVGTGFSFDGTNDYVDFGNPAALQFSANRPFSIDGWIKPEGSGHIVSKFNHFVEGEWLVELNAEGRIAFQREIFPYRLVSSRTLPFGQFSHFAATYDGTWMRIFVDGQFDVQTDQIGLSRSADNTPVLVGAILENGTPSEFFKGVIDELAIFNRALTSNEIAAIYSAGSEGMCKPQLPPSIVQQPTNVTIFITQPASFHVQAVGDAPLRYQWRFNGVPVNGETNDTVTFASAQPSLSGGYDVVVSNPLGSVTSIVATLTVRTDIPDLAATNVSAPATAVIGQIVPFIFTITNSGVGAATLPWSNSIFLATNSDGSGARVIGTFAQPAALAAGADLTITQSVILPLDYVGAVFAGVAADSANQVFETNEANNTAVAMTAMMVTAPDLEVSLLTSAATAEFGQPLNVTWAVRNRGTAPTFAAWTDTVLLAPGSNSLAGATALRAEPSLRSLAPGESYTNTAMALLPFARTLQPGTFFLALHADSANTQPEFDEANNVAARAISLSLPPLPDLAATNVSSPTNAAPGQTIAVTWTVTNAGAATVSSPWTETLRLVAAEVTRLTNSSDVQSLLTSAATLATLTFSNALAPGAFAARTQFVTLPVNGQSGDLRIAVTADARDDVFEENETNNTAFADAPLHVPLTLSLQLASAQISEAATAPLRVTLSRNGDRSQSLEVLVTNDGPAELSFAAGAAVSVTNVLIPAGQGAIAFDLFAVPDHVVDSDRTVTLAAVATGYESATASVTVLNADAPTLTLSAASNAVVEGFAINFTVTRDVVTSNALVVALNSSNPGQLSPPASVTIPAGAASATFTALAVDDVNAEGPAAYSISANAPGFNGGAASITVLDNDVPQLAISLSMHSVSEGAGPQALSMTVTRTPIGAGALTIEPVAGDPSLVITPIRITIPAGQAARSFPIGVVDDSLVNGSRPVTLGAFALATGSGARLAEATPDLLTVLDDDGPALKLSVAQSPVGEGRSPATSATVTRNTPATNALLVALLSSHTNEAIVPASVTMPMGAVSVSFPVATVADGTNDGNQTVTLTATADGFTEGVQTIVVSDSDLPDLVVSSVSSPAAAIPQQRVSISYRLANNGLSATAGSFLTRVYLSRDAVVGDDTLVAQFRTTNALAIGSFIDNTEQIQLPLAVGNYWVVVETDAEQTLAEILEDNNVRLAGAPIAVAADYGAWVQTDVSAAPAGTTIPLYGRATNSLGAPVAGKPVNIHVLVRGTRRTLSAMTDQNGDFATAFVPLPGEAGRYEIFATHPGVSSGTAQDSFSLFGFRASPSSLSLTIIEGATSSGAVTLENLSDVPLNGLAVEVVSKPANLDVMASVASSQLSTQTTINYRLTASTADAYGTVQLRVTAAEGVSQDIFLGVSVEPLRPRLVATPANLFSAMAVGSQTVVEFDLANAGGRASGPITVSLPAAPWMHLATTNPLANLAPGESNRVTLLLTPARDLPLGPYTGNFALSCSNASLSVPFNFRAVSVAVGDLVVDAVDEFTYYAEGAPHLAGATVTVRDAVAQTNIVIGITDTNGLFAVSNLNEGYYDVEVTAEKHTSYLRTHLVQAAKINQVQPFLSRQTVSYSWTVEPVEIEDRYKIVIDTTFETLVPVPVITIEPSVIDLSTIGTGETQVDLKIVNHGLIAAQNARITLPAHPGWEFISLITEVGSVSPQTSITVPLTIRRSSLSRAKGLADAKDSAPCHLHATVCWDFPCGERRTYCAPVAMPNAWTGCGGGLATFSGITCVGCNLAGQAIWGPMRADAIYQLVNAYVAPLIRPCNSCEAQRLTILTECTLGAIPVIGCGFSIAYQIRDCEKLRQIPNPTARDKQPCIWNTAGAALSCFGGFFGNAFGYGFCLSQLFIPCESGPETAAKANAEANWLPRAPKEVASGAPDSSAYARLQERLQWLEAVSDAWMILFGNRAWLQVSDEEAGRISNLLMGFQSATDPNGSADVRISADEAAALFAMPLPRPLTLEHVERLIERWNRTVDYWGAGIDAYVDVPAGQSTEFVGITDWLAAWERVIEYHELSLREGATNILDSVVIAHQLLKAEEIQRLSNEGPCARAGIRLEQDAVTARDAFRAMLELDNGGPSRLEDVRVEIRVRGEANSGDSDLFSVRFERSTGLSAVDGTGILPGNSSGTAKWLIIPTVDAAPTNATTYLVGGTLSYRLDGNDVTVPLAEVPITVLPSPRLALQYFHQRDVYADDPFTARVEPSIPYSLAVMVRNRGFGEARNFRITSAQPRIVDNEKGLLINFNIIASEVAGQAVSPSLTVNFGNIGAGAAKIGRWLFTSSLQGLFTDYRATFEHIDGLGNPRLSLIDDVSIHEMIHLVQAGGAFEDGQPDFLVNEVPDINDYPDTLYLSDGSTSRVEVVEFATIAGALSPSNLQVNLTAPMPGGWAYLRVPDPGGNDYRLTRVVRSDGVEIPVNTNAWTTDRTFIGLGRPPVRENILHLLDYDSGGSYTLYYEPGSTTILDTNPPASSVAALPGTSRQYFQVSWSGADEGALGQPVSGLASYDVFVSENNGPFVPWLQQTPLVSATYVGALGSRYAFYSVATDANGNRESVPPTPDAETVVSLTNSPPSLALAATAALNEGETLDVPFTATDPDATDHLTFALLPGAPPGLVLNAATRRLTWTTGEGNGPTTNAVAVVARDDGFPSLTATGYITIVVHELNAAPVLAGITNRTIAEGQLMTFTADASDLDLPKQALTFSLASAPAGATINATSGQFTWRPAEYQGGTNYTVSIAVTDSGAPPLSATQSFNVTVRNTLNDFAFSLGSTNVTPGETNSVPVLAASGAELNQISFLLETDPARLAGLDWIDLAPEVSSVSFQPLSDTQSRVALTAFDALAFDGAVALGRLRFIASTNEHSAIVPLRALEVSGRQTNGNVLANPRVGNGRVFIVGREPILDAAQGTNGARQLTLYGHAGRRYVIETRTNFENSVWQAAGELDLPSTVWPLDNMAGATPAIFFRVAEQPAMDLAVSVEPDGLYVTWSADASGCVLEETTSLAEPVQWTPVSGAAKRADGRMSMKAASTGTRFFRLRCSGTGLGE